MLTIRRSEKEMNLKNLVKRQDFFVLSATKLGPLQLADEQSINI